MPLLASICLPLKYIQGFAMFTEVLEKLYKVPEYLILILCIFHENKINTDVIFLFEAKYALRLIRLLHPLKYKS